MRKPSTQNLATDRADGTIVALECSRCGAPYKGTIPRWVEYVTCEYCGAAIQVRAAGESIKLKEFSLQNFGTFLRNKGIQTFDPASGILRIGSREVCIDDKGVVTGPGVLKQKVERWIAGYMSE